MHMPNVYVHPPEEDHSPVWCCFDAGQASTPPSSILETRSVLDAYTHDESPFDDDNQDDDCDTARRTGSEHDGSHFPSVPGESYEHHDAGNDSEVVEVVKLSRRRSRHYNGDEAEGLPSQHPVLTGTLPIKRTSTFKARASRAFRSFAGSLRSSKSRPPPVPSSEEDLPRSHTPTLSRRGSIILSQIFHAPSTTPADSASSLRSRGSITSFESSRPNTPSFTLSSQPERAISPTPSTASRRLSRINLRKVFSFSSRPSFSDSSSGRTTPTVSSSSGPQTPVTTDEDGSDPDDFTPRHRSQLPPRFDAETAIRLDFSSPTPTKQQRHLPDAEDTSFEMRLDSLHFDELSFDTDQFILPNT